MKKLVLILCLIGLAVPVFADHLRADGYGGYYYQGKHYRKDDNGGLYTPSGKHIRADGYGGYYYQNKHFRSDGNGGLYTPEGFVFPFE